MNEYTSIGNIKGIGEKTEKLFNKIGITNVGDFLRYFPRGYNIYSEPKPIAHTEEGQVVTIQGAIYGKVNVNSNAKIPITTIFVKDITGTIKAIWFRMPFLKNTIKGGVITLRGKIVIKNGQKCMEQPEIFYPCSKYSEKLNSLQPIYPLASGISNNLILKTMHQILANLSEVQDVLPDYITQKMNFQTQLSAYKNIHFPQTKEDYIKARERFVFEEFLVFIIALRKLKSSDEIYNNYFEISHIEEVRSLIDKLPFQLTNAQKKVWQEIENDMCSNHIMSRLIQGDVGSGKTILATLALGLMAFNGYQGALMAPTEVLAKQHYESIKTFIDNNNLNFSLELLTGSMTAKEKEVAYQNIYSGKSKIIIGTHALFQEKVEYHNLALVITDEQHRFGVRQREIFAKKGAIPHVLVMSATPIPRTLAMIIYGDLKISVIDELPKNRLPIKNCVVDTSYRPKAYDFISKQILQGRQCYVICPMVEESELMEGENVIDYAEKLKTNLPSTVCVEYLHGKMKQEEKDNIMERFSKKLIHVLVSTTVIEVGIDVPNATVIMIENAERFGLAQLHQLRGRVGRGKHQSYCIFMATSMSKEVKNRLDILNNSNDGFYIAEKDLQLRGPGDLFGIRQSGLLDFKIADVFQDSDILQKASMMANEILTNDPELNLECNKKLNDYLHLYLKNNIPQLTL